MNEPLGFRQGDVLAIPVKAIPKTVAEVEPEDGRLILARGEATGHHHSFPHARGVTLFRDDGAGAGGTLYFRAEPGADPLTHQEHSAIPVKPINYMVRPQVEWSDANEPVPVRD